MAVAEDEATRHHECAAQSDERDQLPISAREARDGVARLHGPMQPSFITLQRAPTWTRAYLFNRCRPLTEGVFCTQPYSWLKE